MEIKSHLDIQGKKVLIVGNRSYRNLWDELILLWTIKLLQQQKRQVLVAAYDPTRLEQFLSQFIDTSHITFLTEIPKWRRSLWKYITTGKFKERKTYKKADAIIIGGGEILTEESKNAYRYRLISILPCLRKPRYLMGWIQIPKKRKNTCLFRFLLKRTKKIFARDEESVQELKDFWFEHAEFFMDTSYFAYDRKKKQQSEKKYIVVNINYNAKKFLPEILQDIQKFYNQWYEIYYVPVAKWANQAYSDITYAKTIQKELKLSDQWFKLLDREKDFEYFIQVLSQVHMVISSRLHLFLLASFLGVPTKVYPYQKKILKMQKIVENL
jgi:polysaccharide pyruvyl transferase WcaK-like protein